MLKWILVIAGAAVIIPSARADASGEASFLLGRTYVDSLRLEDQTSFGATIGFFGRFVGFELGFDYMPTSDFDVPGVDLGASVANLTGNVVVQAPLGGFVPYATVGYGGFFANASGDLDTDEFLGTYGAFNYGLGVKYFFAEKVGLRIDYRRFAIQTDEDDPSLEIPVGGIAINSEPDVDRFMAGVVLRW
jgi:opacity protein-like surface antigen